MTLEELKTKTLAELKAIAYDQLVALQNFQESLKVVEALIKEKSADKKKS